MNKKQLNAFIQSLVLRIQAAANKDGSDEPALEEVECRTLLGIHLRQNGTAIVSAIVHPDGEPAEPAPADAS